MMKRKYMHLLTALVVFFILACYVLPGKVQAATVSRQGTCGDNVSYTLDSNGVMTFTGSGAMKDYSDYYAPWYNKDWEDEIKTVVISSGITYVGNATFYGCYNLTSVSLPDTVTSIGSGVFNGCAKLTTINLPSGLTEIPGSTFYGCKALASVTIPSGVTKIGSYAFSGTALTSFTVSAKVKEIGEKAFYNCSSLTKITVNSSNTVYSSDNKGVLFNKSKTTLIAAPGALSGSYTIASTVTTIEKYAFYNCANLTSISISSKVTDISECAFYGCGFTTVTIPSSVKSIGSSAFASCAKLATISIPSMVMQIGGGAFSGTPYWENLPDGLVYNGSLLYAIKGTCPSSVTVKEGTTVIGAGVFASETTLQSISLPTSLKSIGSTAFRYCSGLTTVTIPEGVTSIGDQAFMNCTALTSIQLPSSITELGVGVFNSCKSLTSVNIPSGLKEIPASLFSYCYKLDNLYLPVGLEAIGGRAFYYCSALSSIYIPSGVTAIGDSAFEYCSRLSDANIPATVTQLGEGAFAGCKKLTSITVPSGITKIPNTLFSGCTSLSSISLPSGLKEIGSYAFMNCCFTSVTLPDALEVIGDYAFKETELSSIRIPNSVKTIGQEAFYYCPLDYVYIGTGVQSIDKGAFTIYTTPSVYIYDLEAWMQIDFADILSTPVNHGPLYINGTQVTSITVPSSITEIKANVFAKFPESVTNISLHSQITDIGEDAFSGCSGLTAITIPSKVKTIGAYAFNGCTGLTSITIPYGVASIGSHAFYDCDGLSNVIVPDSVTSIGSWAFAHCDKLESLQLSKNLKTIPARMVTGCYNMRELNIPAGVTTIDQYAISMLDLITVTIPSTVTSIDATAFEYTPITHVYYTGSQSQWDGLTKPAELVGVSVHCNVSGSQYTMQEMCSMSVYTCKLCAEAFGCIPKDTVSHRFSSGMCTICGVDQSLKYTANAAYGGVQITGYTGSANTLAIPSVIEGVPVVCIAENTFKNCTSLTEIIVPESVNYIQEGAFSGCRYLQKLTLPFIGCTRINATDAGYKYPLGYIFGSSSYTGGRSCSQKYSYGTAASPTYTYDYYYIPSTLRSVTVTGGQIHYGAFSECDMLTEVNLPENITAIGGYAFYECNSIRELEIPKTVASVGSYAFYYCSSLQKLILPNITEIAERTFYNCSSLKELYIPKGVGSIGDYAFYNCYGIKELTIPEGVKTIGSTVFYNCKIVHLVLPKTLTSVGSSAFNYCSALKQICYTETETQSKAITISSSGNSYLKNAQWCYDAVDPVVQPVEGCVDIKHICSYCQRTAWTETKATPTHDFAEATCTTPKTCKVCSVTEGEALGHSGDMWFEIVPASCMEEGIRARICAVCNATETVPIPANGHAYGSIVTAPTCTEKGYTTNTCAACGDVIVTDYVDAKGHSFGDWMEIVAPGCAAEGMKARMCACGETENQPVAALGHNYVSVLTVPTCTEQGYTTFTCNVCGDSYKDSYVDAKGHSFGGWVQIVAPDCTTEGMENRTCDCGETETQPVAALGHKYESAVTAPTCTEKGYTTNTCTVCGDVTVTDYVDAKGHIWSAWIQTKAPTCTTEGSQVRFCNCGTRETQPVEKLPHTYANGICSACDALESHYWVLSADASVKLSLAQDLYVDLNGFDLSGTITTNGYQVYGMDSTTKEYSCNGMGYFTCVDENGKAIEPVVQFRTDEEMTGYIRRYMTIQTQQGYTFHRFYLGITNVSLAPSVTGFGYKAEFYGDEMVQNNITSIGFDLWITENYVISRTCGFKNILTLRLTSFDAVKHGEVPVNASATMTLADGTVIKTATHTATLRGMLEKINDTYQSFKESQLAAVEKMIEANPVMKKWNVDNLYQKEDGVIDIPIPNN